MIRWILLASLCWSLAAHAEVYKWVDKDGNVHFTDQKPEAENNAEIVDTSATELSADRAQAARQRDEARAETASQARMAETESKEQRARRMAADKQKQDKRTLACQRGRQNLLAYNSASNRMYRTGADGERIYLTDDERVASEKTSRKMIEENCD